jgi:conjugative transfer pilus assembly protein TraH
MNHKTSCRLTAIALALAAGSASADLGGDVQSFFNDINYQANLTKPGVYQGQQAGYYTGGGLYARVPVRTYTLASIQAPHFSAGCGGINLYSGGFSFINGQQFTQMLQNIGQNATSLAFLLALSVVSPQIQNAMSQVQTWMQQFNNFQINSCQTAAAAVGGVASLLGNDAQACAMQGVGNGDDWATASTNCNTNPSYYAPPGTPAQGLPFTDGNLAWTAMMQIPAFYEDTNLALAVMNLTGTVIISGNGPDDSNNHNSGTDPAPKLQYIPSILRAGADPATGNLVDAILHGTSAGAVNIVTCTDPSTASTACVNFNSLAPATPITITQQQALVPLVYAMLLDIAGKITSEQPLTTEEQGLLESTSLPVYKYLTVTTALLGGLESTGDDLNLYSELIAKDLLYSYLKDVLQKVESGASQLTVSADQDHVRQFLDNVQDARKQIYAADNKVTQDFDAALTMTRNTQFYEQMLIGRLSPGMAQSAWFQGRQ